MQPIYPTDSINFMFSPLPSRGKHILHTADPSMLEPDQNDPVAYGDQRASGKPLGFWKSDRVPCLPPMVTDITVQHSAVSSLLQKRKGVSLSLLPMSLSLHVGPASEYACNTAMGQTTVTCITHTGISTTLPCESRITVTHHLQPPLPLPQPTTSA
mmetsp:Transcript_60690/g.166667  ORF Transcript_60690/g.166667 Transcript_60690/m.166667 type:complete len:156 (+) Transcript_60690:45-512(+)